MDPLSRADQLMSDRRALVVVLALAGVLRLWGTFDHPMYYVDEEMLVPSAVSLAQYGTPSDTVWAHPPLGSLLVMGAIGLFGDNPLGWRIVNVLMGTASAGALYAVALRLYPGGVVPLLAASLLALDPFHALYSRTAYAEIPLVLFFLLYLFFLLEYAERRRPWLPLAGLALGFTVATKNNYAVAMLLAAAYAFHRGHENGTPLRLLVLDFILCLVVLPAAVYLLSFGVWFGRGYTISEFIRMRLDAYHFLKSMSLASFLSLDLLNLGGSPWEWFLKLKVFGYQLSRTEHSGIFRLEINNAPFRMLVLPAVAWAAMCAWKHRNAREGLAPALFLSCYLVVLALQRPIFCHSALVTLPFAYLTVAWAVDRLTGSALGPGAWLPVGFLAAVLVWGLYTFPLYSSISVSSSLYRPILSVTKIIGMKP